MGKRLINSKFLVVDKKSVDFYRIKSSYELHFLQTIENVGNTEFEVPLILFNHLKSHVIYIINSALCEFV